MEQNNNSNQPNLPVELITGFIKTEQMKAQNITEELKLRSKEIDTNERLAKIAMDNQFKTFQNAQPQHRKTTIIYVLSVAFLLLIFLGFLGYLVINGQTAFADKFLGYIAYMVVSIGSFVIGRYSMKNKSMADNTISEAQIIQ